MRILLPLAIVLVSLVLVLPPGLAQSQGTDDDTFETYGAEPRPLPEDVQEMVVERVTDGDTLRLTFPHDDWYDNVRIIGIDTPEKDGPYTDDECYGTEASAALASLLPEGTYVYVEVDEEEEDRNGRWLRHIWLPFAIDDEDVADQAFLVSEMLVRGGFADARSYRPNTKYDDILADAEADARTDDLGFWGAC